MMNTKKTIAILIATALLITITGSAILDARAVSTGVRMSGGEYVLVPNFSSATQTAGYMIQAVTTPEAGSGCCCKEFLPCIRR